MISFPVDFSDRAGEIKPLNAVNNGPAGSRVRGVSNFDDYKALHIPNARLHDASFYSGYGGEFAVDVHRVFPDFSADENNPASYLFAPTDAYLSVIAEAGTGIFYRLGASIEHGFKKGTYPPADYEKWARICAHIIRHYNEGWANGFHFGITYVEIWNEPDCRNGDGSNPCWQGTPREFADFLDTAARYLKKEFPALKIGGPAFCTVWGGESLEILACMAEKKTPLDFISYHWYGKRITDFRDTLRKAPALFAAHGYPGIETVLNEWNYIRGWVADEWRYSLAMEKGQKGAAFVGAAMCVAQSEPLDMLMYYDARPCGMNGIFQTDTLAPLPAYTAFRFFSTVRALGDAVRVSQNYEEGLYGAAAFRGGRGAVLLSRFSDEDGEGVKEVSLSLRHAGAQGKIKVSLFTVGPDNRPQKFREEILSAEEGAVILSLPQFSVILAEIEPYLPA